MPNLPQSFIRYALASLGLAAITVTGLTSKSLAQYQGHEGDIIVIGNSPKDWSKFNGYWQQLLQLNTPEPTEDAATLDASGAELQSSAPNPEALAAKLLKNLKVSGLKLQPILKLNGSSQLVGTLSNNNEDSVTVSSVNFEVVDSKGKLVQSGSAVPEPSTLAPGQTVTFKADLLGLASDPAYKVRLTQSPIVLQGGV